MIIDGRKIAEEVLARTKARAAKLVHPPHVLAIVANETPATKSYLAIKSKRAADAGCMLEVRAFPEVVSAEDLQATIRTSEADAIIVQLPLPAGIDTKVVCDTIPVEKDADVLSSAARAAFESLGRSDFKNSGKSDLPKLLPPVVGAVKEILEQGKIEIVGKKAVVVGKGFLVGAPGAIWLTQQGAHVTVTNRSTENFSELLRDADIIISGAGSPHLITPDMIQQGLALLDAGTSESNGEVVGDADPACAAKCSIFTPVPGGVGPLAVAKLFENAVTLAEKATPA